MKCFHFTNGDRRPTPTTTAGDTSATKRVSWARSLSVASSCSTSTSTTTNQLRKSDLGSDSDGVGSVSRGNNELRGFSYTELKSATRGFNRGLLIGEGGFGCVYRGVINGNGDGVKMDVAIKQLNRYGFQGHKEWVNEVNLLGVIKHPNLVKLVGYCAEDDERGIQRLLIYELMKNKSLEDHLLGHVPSPLSWMTRLKIAQDAARGLAHLHEKMDFQLIFRDFKTSNILLDEHLNAKLSDFGLARLGPPEGYTHVSTAVVGTMGYAAPEYVLTGKLTVKSDVWSYGVVLFELITGRRAVEKNLPRNQQILLDWVKPFLLDSKKFHLIMDPRLEGQYCKSSAQRLVSLANRCLAKQPRHRPKMSEVVDAVGDIIDEVVEDGIAVSQIVRDECEEQVGTIGRLVNLRNKSIGGIDWKSWAPGLIRTTTTLP